jgi:hypothetical protein
MQYTEKDVAQLVADVEKAFTAHLAKAESSVLAKSEDGEKDHEEKEEHKEKPEHKEHEEHEEHEEKPEHEAKEHHEEGEAHEGHEGHDHDYDEEDMEHMHKMYRSMSKGELAVHHEAIKKCIETGASAEPHGPEGKVSSASKEQDAMVKGGLKKSDGNGGEMESCSPSGPKGALSPASKEQDDISKAETGKIESCEPKKTPGAKSPASKADGVQMMEKSENQEVELLKTELAAEKAEKAAIKEFLTLFAKKAIPQGKAITSLDVVAKSEMPSEDKSLSKKEVHEILKSKTADPSLKKSDRDAITSYYLNGQVNVQSISHLLK